MLKVVVNPAFAQLRQQICAIAERDGKGCKQIFQGRNKIFRTELAGVDLTVKSFRVPSLFNRIVYSTFRRSKARRSYENAVRLLQEGISTPEPIAWVEERRCGLLRRSYYFCLYCDGVDIRHWETRFAGKEKDEFLRQFAQFTLLLHDKGVFFKDFSPGNFLMQRIGDNYRFWLVDINRMQFDVQNRSRLYRNFRSINIESPEETALFAEAYARASGLDANEMRTTALKMLNSYYRDKAVHRALKRLIGKH